jgi:hypothetical protein
MLVLTNNYSLSLSLSLPFLSPSLRLSFSHPLFPSPPSLLPQLDSPFTPKCKSAGDPSNFDDYEEEPLRISSAEKFAKEFADF